MTGQLFIPYNTQTPKVAYALIARTTFLGLNVRILMTGIFTHDDTRLRDIYPLLALKKKKLSRRVLFCSNVQVLCEIKFKSQISR